MCLQGFFMLYNIRCCVPFYQIIRTFVIQSFGTQTFNTKNYENKRTYENMRFT